MQPLVYTPLHIPGFIRNWTLFRNSLRSSKRVVSRVASALGMLLAFGFAMIVALGLAAAAYALTSPEVAMQAARGSAAAKSAGLPSAELAFFGIFSLCYLLWASLPLSIGSNRQFDPGRLLMYPISLRKLFAIDFISEVTSLQSVFAIPAIFAMGLGAGLARGRVVSILIAMLPAAAFGLALSKWLSTSIGSLTRRRRTRAETVIALIGGILGLGGALLGQIAPVIFRHAEWFAGLRWTPPGAAAFLLISDLNNDPGGYFLAVGTLTTYTVVLGATTFWIARRSVLGIGERRPGRIRRAPEAKNYTGWHLPLRSLELAAVVEKELRYFMRNAQIKTMGIMPLILIVVRIMNTRRAGQPGGLAGGATSIAKDFFTFGNGLMATGGVLYIFLILSGLWCNQFAFEEGGMRAFILSPVSRTRILIGKNIAITLVALLFTTVLLLIDELIFQDLTPGAILFVGLSFVIFSATMALIGNWFSIRFPRRMKFGKRSNVSGIVSLLLLPMIALLALPPLAATAAGYVTRSLLVEYATLLLIAALAIGFYLLLIDVQGQSLQRREIDVLEAVREPTED